MRITRNDLPDVMPENEPFVPGKPHLIRQGNHVVAFANGQMVSMAVAAADKLADAGISLRVVNVSSMKPVDKDALAALADGMKGVVTLEEHSRIGGLACPDVARFCRGEPCRCDPSESTTGSDSPRTATKICWKPTD